MKTILYAGAVLAVIGIGREGLKLLSNGVSWSGLGLILLYIVVLYAVITKLRDLSE